MAALLVTLAIMFLGMSVATPTWQYLVKNMKEEELIFRGGQIADAVQRFQAKNGNAVPPSLDVLVEGRYLRKLYTDPMTKDGEWRLIRLGEAVGPVRPPGQRRPGAGRTQPRPPAARRQPSTRAVLGGIVGVASTSTEEGLRLFNGRSRYDQWVFAVGQPRIVGRRPVGPTAPGLQPGQRGVPGPGGRPAVPGVRPPGARPGPGSPTTPGSRPPGRRPGSG